MSDKLMFILILTMLNVGSVFGQGVNNKSLIDFLSKTTGKDLNVTNVYYEEILGYEQEIGIYKFGVSGSHQDIYFFLKKGKDLKIIETLRMECIIIEISNFLLEYSEKISFQDRVRYYYEAVSLIEENTTNNPWGIDK